jgi:hypothetical protein
LEPNFFCGIFLHLGEFFFKTAEIGRKEKKKKRKNVDFDFFFGKFQKT